MLATVNSADPSGSVGTGSLANCGSLTSGPASDASPPLLRHQLFTTSGPVLVRAGQGTV
ncbi:hypothetical protein [Actinomadura rubrisoli]|uniref:hypothetical protein n=1 Tax=Actinomadura rubrisoli TaxID=2530368 RepID=UPI00140449F5|nr:hypothetical protein [Actinomadura rubrisoli]